MKNALMMLCALPLVLLGGCGGKANPEIYVDSADYSQLRFASPIFKATIPVTNRGDATLAIANIKKSCSGCMSVSIDRTEVPPKETAYIRLSGKLGKDKIRNASLFVESNDPNNKVLKLDLSIQRVEGYTVDVGWEGDSHKTRFPQDKHVFLSPRFVGTQEHVVATVLRNSEQPITELVTEINPAIMAVARTEKSPGSATVYLKSTAEKPSVKTCLVTFTVDNIDKIVIPVQELMLCGMLPEATSLSFSYLRKGSATFVECPILLEKPPDALTEFAVIPPKRMERAISLAQCRMEQGRALLTIKVDSRFIDGEGAKTVPIRIVNTNGEGEAYVTLFGHIY